MFEKVVHKRYLISYARDNSQSRIPIISPLYKQSPTLFSCLKQPISHLPLLLTTLNSKKWRNTSTLALATSSKTNHQNRPQWNLIKNSLPSLRCLGSFILEKARPQRPLVSSSSHHLCLCPKFHPRKARVRVSRMMMSIVRTN